MGYASAQSSALALLAFSLACSSQDPSLTAADTPAAAQSVHSAKGPPLLPAWITDPEHFPLGLRGRNNCAFAFGQSTAQWDFHPDGACWERPGPDGWTRQQQYRVHVPSLASCGGGAGDVSPIRVCRTGGAGQTTPCQINPLTGPNGCALCVAAVVCHP